MDQEKREIAVALFELGVVKFGEFRLKSGILSPIYVDVRLVISSPDLLMKIAKALSTMLCTASQSENDVICGVPYSALPVATCVSINTSIPLVMCRKEAKTYGTKQMVEGVWKLGQKCVIIEDVVTSGSSIAAVAQLLREEGICVSRGLVLVDRQQGGVEILNSKWKVFIESLFTLSELTDILCNEGRISLDDKLRVQGFISANKVPEIAAPVPAELPLQHTQIPLEQLILSKSSRLCVAIDVTDPDQLLRLTDLVGPKVCAVKLHMDFLSSDPNPQRIVNTLRNLSAKHGFLIVEDRKLADIGQTVLQQLKCGIYRLADWCDMVTAHSLPGPGLFDAFREVNRQFAARGSDRRLRVLVVIQMSSKGNLFSQTYTAESLNLCKANMDVLGGFVCQNPLEPSDCSIKELSSLCCWVPGVRLDAAGDQLGQEYNHPECVIKRFGGTSNVVLIVGRGITEASDVAAAAELYRSMSIST